MAWLSTLSMAWAAVHTYVGIFYGIVYLRRRTDREYLAFSVLSFAMAAYAFGVGRLIEAESVNEGTHAMRIAWVGATITPAALVDFCFLLIGRSDSRVVRSAYAVSGVGLVLHLSGLFFDPSVPTQYATGLGFAPHYQEPSVLWPGAAWFLAATAVTGHALLQVARWARVDSDLRYLVAAIGFAGLAGAHDIVVNLAGFRAVYLFEHAAILASFAVSYMLLRRFMLAGDELERRTRELRRSYEELRQVQRQLVRQEQLAAVGELSAVIAHEVRNPLAILKNAVSGLRRTSLSDDDRTTLLAILDEESDRLNRLVHDLLTYARPISPRAEPVPVATLIHDAIDATTGKARAEELSFELELDDGPEQLKCDPGLLRRALSNIVENAVQAMPQGGVLTVRSREDRLDDEPALALEFLDSGEGMDTLVRSKARDPFFTTRPAGTGLGLAIVERVVKAHGGQLRIDSRYGSGTHVTVVLPLDPGLDSQS